MMMVIIMMMMQGGDGKRSWKRIIGTLEWCLIITIRTSVNRFVFIVSAIKTKTGFQKLEVHVKPLIIACNFNVAFSRMLFLANYRN